MIKDMIVIAMLMSGTTWPWTQPLKNVTMPQPVPESVSTAVSDASDKPSFRELDNAWRVQAALECSA
jgi:hypothetical protein